MLQLNKKRLSLNELIKLQKWQLSRCSFFYNSQWFLAEAGTISLNYSRLILKCSFSLKPYCNFSSFPLVYIKERERLIWFSHGSSLLYKFWLSLVLRKTLIYYWRLVCLLLFIVPRYEILAKIRIHYGE